MTILLDSGSHGAPQQYAFALGTDVTAVGTWPQLTKALAEHPDEVLVVLGPDLPLQPALAFAEAQRLARPGLGVLLLRKRVNVGVLGAALRAGVRDVVSPDDTQALAEACQRSLEVSRRTVGWVPAAEAKAQGRVITVFAAKGGCGKTTVATNLSAALAAGGARSVCLVDLDLSFGDVAIAMQLFPTRTISDAVAMQDKLDEAGVRSLLTPHSPGLDTLLAPLEPGDAQKIPTAVVTEVLGMLRRTYDFVVVDTPPDFKDWVLAALDLSDVYVLLATLDVPALKNLKLTLDMLDLLGYSRECWQVVLNRADSQVGLQLSDVEKMLKVPIAALIPSSRAVSTSVNRGIPLVLEQPHHPVSKAVRAFSQGVTITGGRASAAPAVPRGHGAARTLFSKRKAAVT